MIILSDDVIKSAAAITATSTAAGFSVNNLKDDRKGNSWRSTAISSQTITATWSSPQTINAVGIAFANVVAGSTVRVRLFTNTGDSSPVVDSGVQTISFVYPPPAGFAANNLASFAYGGGNHYLVQVAPANVRKLEVVMVNPSGADAFIEAARIVAGNAISFDKGVSYGAGIGIEDLSDTIKTDAGSTVTDRRPASRIADFSFPALSHSDRAKLQAIIRRNGRHTPLFASAFQPATDASIRTDLMIYGCFDDLDLMRLNHPGYSGINVRIREV